MEIEKMKLKLIGTGLITGNKLVIKSIQSSY